MLFILIPGYYLYMVVYMQPYLVQAYNPGNASRIFNIAISTFGVINIVGNLIMSLTTNVKLKHASEVERSGNAVSYCKVCKVYCPEKAWHCRVCNVCILNRDHHCTFFATCVGRANLRYYILYIAYIFFALTYYNYHFYNYLSIKDDKETPFTFYEAMKVKANMEINAVIICSCLFQCSVLLVHYVPLPYTCHGAVLANCPKQAELFLSVRSDMKQLQLMVASSGSGLRQRYKEVIRSCKHSVFIYFLYS
ncbi:DHHC palmitoyltransferase domain-containing protein [Phthorimaea operculella]|nr:DHHC palmitoyltransferase domain-containing protein [Phthorimaea operculella]